MEHSTSSMLAAHFTLFGALILYGSGIAYAQPDDIDGRPPSDNEEIDADTDTAYTVTGTSCRDTEQAGEDWCSLWTINSDGEVSVNVVDDDGTYALVNVEAVTVSDDEVDDASTFTIYTSGVPNYYKTATQTLIDTLNARPKASTDFVTANATTLEVGDEIVFAGDIGYINSGCELGFWPPGPGCPEDVATELIFPTWPAEPATQDDGNQCFIALGVTGVFLNGVSMFGWGDGFSYNQEDVWHNNAVVYEIYDLDICGGHAASGEYHHHSYSSCIQEMVNDDGLLYSHAPKVGMTPDGYFHYGLYQELGVKAQSCWRTRDYSNASDPLGCGGTGERTCVLVDNLDPDAGTESAEYDGPTIDEEVESLSTNVFVAVSGSYYEDWYFDSGCYAQGGEHLDEHNGHSHDDLGYHYHATETFPYYVGPTTYYGQVNVDGWTCDGFDWDEKAQSQSEHTDSDSDSDSSSEAHLVFSVLALCLFAFAYALFVV